MVGISMHMLTTLPRMIYLSVMYRCFSRSLQYSNVLVSCSVCRSCGLTWASSPLNTIASWPSSPLAGPSASRWTRWMTFDHGSAETSLFMVKTRVKPHTHLLLKGFGNVHLEGWVFGTVHSRDEWLHFCPGPPQTNPHPSTMNSPVYLVHRRLSGRNHVEDAVNQPFTGQIF